MNKVTFFSIYCLIIYTVLNKINITSNNGFIYKLLNLLVQCIEEKLTFLTFIFDLLCKIINNYTPSIDG